MKKKNLIAVISIAVAAVILIGVLIWQLGGDDPVPTDPTETSTSSTKQGSAGETTAPDETTAPTETTEPEETQPEETEASTDAGETEPVETEAPATEPVETEPVETQPAETEPVETEPQETEPEVKWTEVNETVYATSTVNVRKGPSADTKKLGSLSKGDSVKRTAIGDNGWSRVEYDGKEAYISSEYLSTKKPADNSTVSYNGLDIAKLAVEYLELKYVYGGNSLKNGVDCSGFTTQIYKQFGIELPRTAAEQSKVGTKVSLENALPGDLYAEEYSDKTNYTGHAGIYIGNGYIISAWPNSGVYITSVPEGTTFRRIGKNTCTTTGEDAIHELEKHLISKGEYGNPSNVNYYVDSADVSFYGSSPLKCGMFDGISISFYLSDVPEGYEDLAEVWKKAFVEAKGSFSVYGPEYIGADGEKYNETWRYLNGVWHNRASLEALLDSNEITWDEYKGATNFYGAPWDKKSTITNGIGEEVDFSTFPEDPYE